MQIDLFSLLTFIVLCAMFSAVTTRLKRIQSRIDWIEHRLEHGLSALGVAPEESPTTRVIQGLVSRGERGEAIRLYQESTGVSFETARDHIDRLSADPS